MKKSAVTLLSVFMILSVFPLACAATKHREAATCTPSQASVSGPRIVATVPEDHYLNGSYSLPVLGKRLRLTKEQKSQMRLLYTGFSDGTRDARTKLSSAISEKRSMLKSGKIDQKRLAELDDQILKARSEIAGERLKLVRDRLALLNAQQLNRLANLAPRRVMQARLKGIHKRMASGRRC
jgi:hypothetical protein